MWVEIVLLYGGVKLLRKQRSNFKGAGSTRRERKGGAARWAYAAYARVRRPRAVEKQFIHSRCRRRRPSVAIDVHLLRETVETFAPFQERETRLLH